MYTMRIVASHREPSVVIPVTPVMQASRQQLPPLQIPGRADSIITAVDAMAHTIAPVIIIKYGLPPLLLHHKGRRAANCIFK